MWVENNDVINKFINPYQGISIEGWRNITQEIVHQNPINKNEIVEIILEAWEKILDTKIGGDLQVGVDIFPNPQNLGNYLHLIIPKLLEKRYPLLWRKEDGVTEKDIVYIPDNYFSIEIKTSSSLNNIYGNRSYTQESKKRNEKKDKNGYYLIINFEKFRLC